MFVFLKMILLLDDESSGFTESKYNAYISELFKAESH